MNEKQKIELAERIVHLCPEVQGMCRTPDQLLTDPRIMDALANRLEDSRRAARRVLEWWEGEPHGAGVFAELRKTLGCTCGMHPYLPNDHHAVGCPVHPGNIPVGVEMFNRMLSCTEATQIDADCYEKEGARMRDALKEITEMTRSSGYGPAWESHRIAVKALNSTAERDGVIALYNASVKKVEELSAEGARMRDALESIANNTCCEGCQEAKRVALAALKGEGK